MLLVLLLSGGELDAQPRAPVRLRRAWVGFDGAHQPVVLGSYESAPLAVGTFSFAPRLRGLEFLLAHDPPSGWWATLWGEPKPVTSYLCGALGLRPASCGPLVYEPGAPASRATMVQVVSISSSDVEFGEPGGERSSRPIGAVQVSMRGGRGSSDWLELSACLRDADLARGSAGDLGFWRAQATRWLARAPAENLAADQQAFVLLALVGEPEDVAAREVLRRYEADCGGSLPSTARLDLRVARVALGDEAPVEFIPVGARLHGSPGGAAFRACVVRAESPRDHLWARLAHTARTSRLLALALRELGDPAGDDPRLSARLPELAAAGLTPRGTGVLAEEDLPPSKRRRQAPLHLGVGLACLGLCLWRCWCVARRIPRTVPEGLHRARWATLAGLAILFVDLGAARDWLPDLLGYACVGAGALALARTRLGATPLLARPFLVSLALGSLLAVLLELHPVLDRLPLRLLAEAALIAFACGLCLALRRVHHAARRGLSASLALTLAFAFPLVNGTASLLLAAGLASPSWTALREGASNLPAAWRDAAIAGRLLVDLGPTLLLGLLLLRVNGDAVERGLALEELDGIPALERKGEAVGEGA